MFDLLYVVYNEVLRNVKQYGLTDSELVTLSVLVHLVREHEAPVLPVPEDALLEALGIQRDTLRRHLGHIDGAVEWIRLPRSGRVVTIALRLDLLGQIARHLSTDGRAAAPGAFSGEGEDPEKSGKIRKNPDALFGEVEGGALAPGGEADTGRGKNPEKSGKSRIFPENPGKSRKIPAPYKYYRSVGRYSFCFSGIKSL